MRAGSKEMSVHHQDFSPSHFPPGVSPEKGRIMCGVCSGAALVGVSGFGYFKTRELLASGRQ